MEVSDYSSAIAPNGNYSASTKTGGVGKYLFSWGIHAPDIMRITGVKSKQEFLDDHDAQEKYFDWHVSHNLQPAVDRLQSLNKNKVSDAELAKLVHFYGENGAKRRLQAAVAQPQQNQPAAQELLHIVKSDNDNSQYKYIHEDRYGNKRVIHEGGALAPDDLNDLLAVSRAHQYQPGVEGDEYRLNTEGLTDKQKEIAASQTIQPHFTPEQLAAWKDYGDPTKNINYVAPAGQQPEVQTVALPDPNFPTRDPITGRVTPAANKKISSQDDNNSGTRKLLNGIFDATATQ